MSDHAKIVDLIGFDLVRFEQLLEYFTDELSPVDGQATVEWQADKQGRVHFTAIIRYFDLIPLGTVLRWSLFVNTTLDSKAQQRSVDRLIDYLLELERQQHARNLATFCNVTCDPC